MSNPFAKFALKNGSMKKESNAAGNSGWLTTKKRGRDDVAIRRDQTKAREAVKQRRRSKSNNSKFARPTAKKAPPPRTTTTTTNRGRQRGSTSRATSKTAKKKNYSSDDDDDYDDGGSMDDFVVDDDEDLSEEQILSSSEEEDLVADDYDEPLSARRTRHRAAAPSKNTMALSDDGISSGESSQDQDTFLVAKDFKSRTSKPIDKRKHLKNISNNNTGNIAGTAKNRKNRPKRCTANNPVNLAESSDESDHLEEEKKWDPQDFNSSSSDDDSLEILESSSRSITKRNRKDENRTIPATKRDGAKSSAATKGSATSRFFSKSNSSNQRSSTTIITSTRRPMKKNGNSFFMDDDDDDDEFPIQSSTSTLQKSNGNNTGKLRKQPIFSDDDDDDDGDDSSDNDIPIYKTNKVNKDIHNGLSLQDTPTPIKNAKAIKKKYNSDDDSDDNIAMALAMSQSLMEVDLQKQKKQQLKQNNNKRLKKKLEHEKRENLSSFSVDDDSDSRDAEDLFNTKKKKNKNRIVYLDDDSDHMMEEEEEELDDAEVDAYMEEDAREANSVLNAANQLSAQVLKTMAEWSQVDGGKKASTGMILDGALAIHDFLPPSSSVSKNPPSEGTPTESTKNGSRTSSSSWISQDVMKRILPNVKLGDYQLIGVNWLALLHGMKCQVEGSKKSNSMNVNGVLADEMGLGKTVQTIAFLAWLKHRHDDDKNLTRTASTSKESPLSIDSDNEKKNCEGDDDDDSAVNLMEDDDKNDDDHNSASSRRNSTTTSPARRPHIVIVPASVLSNWQREFEKFCPSMIVVKYHGTMKEREEIQDQLSLSLPTKSAAATGRGSRVRSKRKPLPLDVVLTTFSYFSSEKSTDRSFLRKFHFDYMVVDEAHCLKSAKGMRYRNLNKFKTSHRLLLTGTPVQNSPKELMSLLCFLMPLFSRSSGSGEGDFDDNNKEDHGGESMLQHFVNIESNGKDTNSEAAYKKLKHLFAPFVLRRRKADVLSQLMPPKTRKVEWVPFDDSTRNVYDSIVASHMQRREDKSAEAEQHLFTALRKAANHPLLLRTRHKSVDATEHLAKQLYQAGYFGRDDTCTVKLVQKELEGFSDFDIHCAALELIEENPLRSDALSRYTLKAEDLFCSPKCKRLSTLLPDLLQDDHRILIFSQWTRCLDLLGCLLDHLDLKYLRLDGQTVISERQRLIDEFNEDASIPIFLLSTRAGGMGINLTAADTCILHDLDFNPFNDIQAEDRCHRIGQKKPVSVIKMITEKTVDADIYEMQQRKAKMNAAILENGSSADASNSVATAGKKKSAKEEKEEINKMLKKTFDRYLHSPGPKDDKIIANSPDILV